MASSKEDIASAALTRLGEPAISSFTEDTETAERVAQLYEPTILSLLSAHDWHFATRRKTLSEDGAATPVNEWRRAFLLPPARTDRVGKPLMVFNSAQVGARSIQGFELQDRHVLTNETTIVIEYVKRVDEDLWPGYFEKLAIEACAAAFALPVTEIASKEQWHTQVAFGSPSVNLGRGGLFRMATQADAIGDPTRSLLDDDDPISAARFGGN